MQRIALIILTITLIVSSCEKSSNANYSSSLSGCLSYEDQGIIDLLCSDFEMLISNEYQKPINLAYTQFLEDLSELKLDGEFYFNDRTTASLKKFRKSNLYTSNWVKKDPIIDSSIPIPPSEGDNQELKFKKTLMYLDYNGEFMSCFKSKNQNSIVNNFLKVIEMEYDLSPHIQAKYLKNSLRHEDLEDSFLRMYIAINLYYETSLSLLDNLELSK